MPLSPFGLQRLYEVPNDRWLVITALWWQGGTINLVEDFHGTITIKQNYNHDLDVTPDFLSPLEAGRDGPIGIVFQPGSFVAVKECCNNSGASFKASFWGYLVPD